VGQDGRNDAVRVLERPSDVVIALSTTKEGSHGAKCRVSFKAENATRMELGGAPESAVAASGTMTDAGAAE
jgi:hypothetical protein